MLKTKYRVVRDSYAGFEAQYRPWWSPFWFQCFGINTRGTVEGSEELCRLHARSKVVKAVDV